jgi:hypothetical protein
VYVRAGAQQARCDFGDGGDHLLAVVEEEHDLTIAQELDERLKRILTRPLRDPKHVEHGFYELSRIGPRCEIDKPHAMTEAMLDGRAEAGGQAALADSAWADQGEMARRRLQPLEDRKLVFSTDKTAWLGGRASIWKYGVLRMPNFTFRHILCKGL